MRFLESRINSSSTENIDFEKFVAREGYTYPNLRRSHDYEERLIGMFGEGVGNGEGKKPKVSAYHVLVTQIDDHNIFVLYRIRAAFGLALLLTSPARVL